MAEARRYGHFPRWPAPGRPQDGIDAISRCAGPCRCRTWCCRCTSISAKCRTHGDVGGPGAEGPMKVVAQATDYVSADPCADLRHAWSR